MYVDYSSDEENAYQFWIARANLSEMEGQSDEIPCQITKNRSPESTAIRRKNTWKQSPEKPSGIIFIQFS